MKVGRRKASLFQTDRRFSRMLILSAVVHVAVIGLILFSAKRKVSPEPEKPQVYTLEFATPRPVQTRGSTKGIGREEKNPPAALRQATEEPVAKPKKTEPLTPIIKPKVMAKADPVVAKKLEPKKEPGSVKPKVTPVEKVKPLVTSKPAEPQPLKKAVETKKKDLPKVAAGEKRPKEKPERHKKIETKAEQKPPEVKPKKNEVEPAKKVTKDPTKVDSETDKKLAKKQTESIVEKPTRKTEKQELANEEALEKTRQRKAEEEAAADRNRKILAAVESVRTRQEAAQRDQEIAAALERVRTRSQLRPTDGSEKKEDRDRRDSHAASHRPTNLLHGEEFLRYTENIKQRVKASWIVPEQKPGLTAIVSFGVEPNGAVFDVALRKTSGDQTFDQSVLRAVKKANPLPPPPPAYQEEFATQKVEVTFGSEERTN